MSKMAIAQPGEAGEVIIDGSIDDNTAVSFLKLVQAGGVRTLRITSGGGYPVPAMVIGNLVYDNGIALVVDGHCMSACASFIFMAARDRTVGDLGLVAFHHTDATMERLLRGKVHDPAYEHYAQRAKFEFAFYTKIGAPLELLMEPSLVEDIFCYVQVQDPNGSTDYGYRSKYNMWTPRPQYLKDNNIEVKGFWPQDPSSFLAAYKKFLAAGPALSLAYTNGKPVTKETVRDALEPISLCADSPQEGNSLVK